MRVENASVQAMFLFAGWLREDDAPDTGQGQIESAEYLSHWASAITTYLYSLRGADWDFPGVFEYEVTEEFGAYLRHNFRATHEKQWNEFLRLSEGFLTRKGK